MKKGVAFAMCVVVLLCVLIAHKSSNVHGSANRYNHIGSGLLLVCRSHFRIHPRRACCRIWILGGHIKNPAYREVCTGRTGHAEVVQLTYDPSKVDLAMILRVFFATHDPTTLNRQGADVGTQYRSAIYIHSDRQRSIAEQAIEEAQSDWPNPIVTEVTDFDAFYPAEDYHQAYYELNKEAPYCRAVIAPKLAKFHKEFKAVIDLN